MHKPERAGRLSPSGPAEAAGAGETGPGTCPYLGSRIVLDAVSGEPVAGVFRNRAGQDVSFADAADDLEATARIVGTLPDITVPGTPSLSGIVSRLRRWGIAVLPGLLSSDTMSTFESEFAAVIMASEELAARFKVDRTSDAVCVRIIRDRLDAQRFPTIATFFASPVMRAVADAYLGADSYRFNHQIFVHRTDPTAVPLSDALHFDVTRMLKFWLYLSDGTEANGAMRAVPGSHLWLRLLRREFSDRLIPKSQIHNLVEEARHPAIPVGGPPGTLFIFDTDAAHGALPVAPGGQRRILRGHCTEDLFVERSKLRGV